MAKKFDRDGIPIKPIRQEPPRRGPGEFGLVADRYLRAGYLPVPVAGKILLIKDTTGYKGVVTPEKVQGWKVDFPTADTALRLEGCLGIDVDHRDKKLGALQLRQLKEEFGPLPPTFSITSRGADSPSRIYLFSVDQDCPRRSKAAKDIEILHKFHRYAVTTPTIHPDTGRRYEWYSPEGEQLGTWLPRPEELPGLPEPWDNYLKTKSSTRHTEGGGGLYSGTLSPWELWLGSEDPTPPVLDLMDRIREEPHIGHNELLDFIIKIHELRALSFEHGLSHALRALKDRYFPETNNTDPEREWDDIVRWVITEAWAPVELEHPPLSSIYSSVVARWTDDRSFDR
jgi:hypothetical protein